MYFLLSIIAILFMYIAERRQKYIWVFSSILILMLLAGFRSYTVGTDTQYYHMIFHNYYNGYGIYFNEKMFMYIAKAIMSIFQGDRAVFVIYAFITNFLIINTLWKYREFTSFTLTGFIYVTLYFPQSMNIMRQYVALAIIFAISDVLFKKKYKLYIVSTILCGFLFHRSMLLAVIILLMYYIITKKSDVNKILILIFIILCLPLVSLPFIDIAIEYAGYFSNASFNISSTLVLEIVLVISYTILFFRKRVYTQTDEMYSFEKFLLFNYMIIIFFAFIGGIFEHMERIGLCFSMFKVLCISRMCMNNRFRKLYKVSYIFLALYYILVRVAINGECGIIPYKFLGGE